VKSAQRAYQSDHSAPGRVLRVVCLSVSLFLIGPPSFPQGTAGRIFGIVTDQTGRVIVGAAVVMTDTQRGISRTLTTDGAGEFDAPNLIPGKYTIRVEAKGFKVLVRENVAVEVSQEVRVDVAVQLGERTDTVTVTESIPLVVSTSATLGGTFNNEDINNMPLNGRNYQSLMGLRPGVMLQPGGGPWTQSTNNIRPDETVWMVDGVINENFFDARPIVGMSSPFTDNATVMPIEAIQEFNMMENPKAEYGWRAGAVVNVGVKSGTNELHGAAYGFERAGAWDARNIFNPGLTNGTCVPNPSFPALCNKLAAQLKQFGGVVGGPIKKDKLFYFAGYEGLRSFIGTALRGVTPETAAQTPADPANSMPDAITAIQKSTSYKGLCNGTNGPICLSPASLSLLGCTGSAPFAGSYSCNGGYIQGAAPNSTLFLSTFPNSNTSDNGVAKIDYRINSKHMVNGMLFTGYYSGVGNDTGALNQAWRSLVWIDAWTATGNWIWTPSSRVVNEVRASYNRTSFRWLPADYTKFANGVDYPLNTGITSTGGFPRVFFFGPSPLGNMHSTEFRPNPYEDLQESVSYLRGKHTFKFGGEFTRIEADSNVHPTQGEIDFFGAQTPGLMDCSGQGGPSSASCPLEDFFAGNPFAGSQLIGHTNLKLTWRSIAGFVQDDWRVTPTFTLNLGLRYSYVSPMKEVSGLLGNFDPKLGLVQQGQPTVGDTVIKPERDDFSPRVGFAWDVTGKGTTVVRAGASMIYSVFTPANFLANLGFGTSLAAVPTGADFVVANTTLTAATNTHGSGTIHLGAIQIPVASLHWDGVVFPSTTSDVQCGDGLTLTSLETDPGWCNIMSVDPNLRYPRVTNWNVSVQHAFTSDLALELNYVGNHGSRLTGVLDLNQAPLGAGYCLNSPLTAAQLADACASGTPSTASNLSPHAEQEARPYAARFPYLGPIFQFSNYGRSNYHSLQVTLTKRLSHGLTFLAGYTYGHGLDNGSLNRFGGSPQDSKNPGAEYASSDFDVRHRFTFRASYDLPGKKGFGQLLEGWKINSIVTLESSQPWLVTGSDFSGTGDGADRWDFFGKPDDFRSSARSIPFCGFVMDAIPGVTTMTAQGPVECSSTNGIYGNVSLFSSAQAGNMWGQCTAVASDAGTLAAGGCFISGSSVMVPPTLGTFGTMGRNIFRDSGFKNWDLSVFKTFMFKDRYGAEFRVEAFNLLNHPLFANPYGASTGNAIGNVPVIGNSLSSTFGCGCATPDFAAGNPIVGSGSNRVLQLALKLTF